MAKLTDESLMPGNGKHAGKPLGEVPADYLLWCYDQGFMTHSVKEYVRSNKDALEKERDENQGGEVYSSFRDNELK